MIISVIFFTTLILIDPLLGERNSSQLYYERFVGSITAVVGRGFSRSYPIHIFADEEWNFDKRFKVTLRTKDGKKLFSNSWISLDSTGEKIIGFPMEGNEGEFTFLLCAEDSQGHVKSRRIRVIVLADHTKYVHRVDMKLNFGIRDFVRNLNHRFLFVTIIADYLQEHEIKTHMSDIWITSIQTQDFLISWTLSTHNTNSCSEILTRTLPKLLTRNGKPHPNLQKKLRPYFSISFLGYSSNVCRRPNKDSERMEKRNLIIGPVLIIIIMIGLSSPIFIAYLIRRGRQKREFRRATDVRHVYSNGVAAPIPADREQNSDASKSREDLSHRMQYRWSPDMTNRVPVQIPSHPPPRPRLCQSGSQCSSMESAKVATWHGLPTDQCADGDGIQLANIVQTISQSATTLKSYFLLSQDRESEADGNVAVVTEEDSFSIKSEGSKILETAIKKVSSLVHGTYFSAPTLIRISRSDADVDWIMTRKSSIETGNSSLEYSIVSSDQLTHSQISSGVNSFDTEALSFPVSLSQDESFSDDVLQCAREDESFQGKESNDSYNKVSHKSNYVAKVQPSLPCNKGTCDEIEVGKVQDSAPLRKASIRGSLQRLPTVHGQDVDTEHGKEEADKSDLLHPWCRDQANVRVQQNKKGSTAQYYIAKVAKIEKTAQHEILQNEIIYEGCYDEGFGSPTMV